MYGEPTDMVQISIPHLASILTILYCEARPKMSSNDQIRSQVTRPRPTTRTRYLSLRVHIGKDVDLVRDKEFKTANRTLDGLLKDQINENGSVVWQAVWGFTR